MLHNQRNKKLVQLVLSSLLLVILLCFLNIEKALQILSAASIGYFPIICLVFLFDRLFMSWKWTLLLNVVNIRLNQFMAFKIYYVSSFMGYAIPFGVGPDVIRFLKLKIKGLNGPKVLASIVIERILGIVATSLMVLMGLIIFYKIYTKSQLDETLLNVLIVLVLGLIFTLVVIFSDYARNNLFALFKIEKIYGWLNAQKYYNAFSVYKLHKTSLLYFIFLSFLEQYFSIFATYLSAKALNIPLDLIICMAFVPITTLVSRLPLSFFGIGFREGSYILLLRLFNIDYTSAMLISILIFSLEIIFLMPAGLWSIFDKPPSVKKQVMNNS
jgi:uncharacterized protein (TIRG00374 family)